ncbi:Thioredoxin-like [Saccharicrinis carchari]|uniref:Thioredoxin-like n=1 Tax=Saccharicrinis carchari TaxID=1168039 RepID=A0A521CDM1_SACCC|nr:hypothetical protein [Saccharicrinis carchari]SMO57526.1 Thioredoxin-like [Saccharicrinis carchari]
MKSLDSWHFFKVMKKYPVALNYNETIRATLLNESNDFLKMSGLKKTDIRIHHEEFISFTALIDKIRKDHLGSVVFIDLWGAWCGACLYDIKHKKALGMDKIFEKYKVQTVYLCTLSPKKEFDYYINKLDMTGDHYFFSREQKQEAKGKFNVYAYPHYMFLNKNGELINDDVPRMVITTKGVARLNQDFIDLVKRLSE